MKNDIFERAKIEIKEESGGGATIEIDFASNDDEKCFMQIVKDCYGMKRYSAKAGGRFLSDALTALKEKSE